MDTIKPTINGIPAVFVGDRNSPPMLVAGGLICTGMSWEEVDEVMARDGRFSADVVSSPYRFDENWVDPCG